MRSYAREFAAHWRVLLAATLGIALGAALNHYMANLFGPALITEFGWKKSQFALVGTLGLASMLVVPLAGRFADRFGARVAAMVGFSVVPLTFVAYSFMTGHIAQYFAITFIQQLFGILTTTLVFCRVVVERFDLARGMALSVVMSGAPLIGAIMVPIIGAVVDAEGWRTGYRVLAVISGLGGLVAILLIGRQPRAPLAADGTAAPSLSRAEFLALARHPVFVLLIGGMFLVNLPTIVVNSQLKLVLLESGAPSRLATLIISLYAVGVVVGRFISGFALDRVPAHLVAIFALGLPAVGFMILASDLNAGWVLAGAVLLIGLAQGAEGDLGAFLISRKFPLRHYSFIYSFLIASIGLASAAGSILLSVTLHRTDDFNLFLTISAAVTVIGALCFFATGRYGAARIEAPSASHDKGDTA